MFGTSVMVAVRRYKIIKVVMLMITRLSNFNVFKPNGLTYSKILRGLPTISLKASLPVASSVAPFMPAGECPDDLRSLEQVLLISISVRSRWKWK